MTTNRKQVADVAAKIIRSNPSGIRWAELSGQVRAALPLINPNTITGSLHHFRNHLPDDIVRPDRGLYAVQGNSEDSLGEAQASAVSPSKHKEQAFYQPFADWLVNDLEEATKAHAIGGNSAGGKWGTPDVIGLFQPRKTDAIQFTEEVVAVEIKIDTASLIVAFGQACAYKLFAHRVYIAVPKDANSKDLKRLDALAGVVGIGLVKFNAEDPENPDFQVMVRAAKHEPDYFYTNELLGKFKNELEL
jgi:hypothetical protein